MILKSKYTMIVCADDFDYKWCSKKGVFCHKDDFGFECGGCRR